MSSPTPPWALRKKELVLEGFRARPGNPAFVLHFWWETRCKYKSTASLTLNGVFSVMTQSQKQKDSHLGIRTSGVCLIFIFLVWVGLKVSYHHGNRILWKQNKFASFIFYPQHWLKLNSDLISYNLQKRVSKLLMFTEENTNYNGFSLILIWS